MDKDSQANQEHGDEEVERTTNALLPGLRDAIQETGQHGWAEFQSLYHEIDSLGKLVDAW